MSAPITYYVMVGDEQKGPYTLSQLQAMWRAGSVTVDTQYWIEGLPEWMPLGSILELLEPPRYLVPSPLPLPAPNRKRRVGIIVGLGCLGVIAVLVMLGVIGWLASTPLTPPPTPEGVDDASRLIAKYGLPDKEDSTAYDSPRPLIVTRFLVYEPEHVRVIFVPKGKVEDPPPYQRWQVIAFQDSRDNQVLGLSEFEERLKNRMR